MILNKEQKGILITLGVMLVVLLAINFTGSGDFIFKQKSQTQTDTTKTDAQKYLEYLETLQIDQKASQELFREIITEQELQAQVEAELGVDKSITLPETKNEQINIVQKSGQTEILEYIASTASEVLRFNTEYKDMTSELFSKNAEADKSLLAKHSELSKVLENTPVPKDAVSAQKYLLSFQKVFQNVISTSLAYSAGENENPWPDMYQGYAAANELAASYEKEIAYLGNKYKISEIPVHFLVSDEKYVGPRNPFFKTAKAFLGVGDISITLGDIPRIIKEAAEEGLAASFSRFMTTFIQKVVDKIESNYMISNFLYYSDALVAGQYADDYLKKYVKNDLDRKIIKRFIPQYRCGDTLKDLRPIFEAKAKEYLGFDPQKLDMNDPQYYEKLSKVGDFLSRADGWKQQYEGMAEVAKSEAEKAAEKELLSSGLKTPRDSINRSIAITLNNLVSVQRASLHAMMDLGISTSTKFISRFVSQMTQTLATKFVFRGATSVQGNLAVLKEQATCLAVAQLQLVIPAADTKYEEPPPLPTQQQLLEAECRKFTRGCSINPQPDIKNNNQP